jgi:hypothetical protein
MSDTPASIMPNQGILATEFPASFPSLRGRRQAGTIGIDGLTNPVESRLPAMKLPIRPSSLFRRWFPGVSSHDRGLFLSHLQRHSAFHRVFSTVGVFLLCVGAGCGTSSYEKRMEEHLAGRELKSKLTSAGLGSVRELVGTPFAVAVPVRFDDPLYEDGKAVGKTVQGKPVEPRRAEPGKFGVPALNLTYEGSVVDLNNGKQPCYCYVGAKPLPPGGDVGQIAVKLRKEWSSVPNVGKVSEVSDFKDETHEGSVWKKIRCEAKQEFYYVNKDGKESFSEMDGVMEAYLHDEAGYLIVIAARMPKGVENALQAEGGLTKWATAIIGNIRVKQ